MTRWDTGSLLNKKFLNGDQVWNQSLEKPVLTEKRFAHHSMAVDPVRSHSDGLLQDRALCFDDRIKNIVQTLPIYNKNYCHQKRRIPLDRILRIAIEFNEEFYSKDCCYLLPVF